MIIQFSKVSIGDKIVFNGLAGVKVSSRTADMIVGEIDGESVWKKLQIKQKDDVMTDKGIVLTF